MEMLLVYNRKEDEYIKIFTDDMYRIRGLLNNMNWKYNDCKLFHINNNVSLKDFKPNHFNKLKTQMLWKS